MSVAVVGAGAVGATAAHELASRGVDVTLYERETPGAGATGRAAGIAYDAFTVDVDADLARRSLERFRARSDDGRFRFTATPYVWFATDGGRAADLIREGVERMCANGVAAELVAPADLRARFPQVRVEDVAVAAVTENAGVADTGAYAALLADDAAAAGATVREGTPASVRADPPRVVVEGESREVSAVLVAAGAHTPSLLADAGLPVPVRPYRVQAARVSGPAIPILYDATADYYARPTRHGVLAGDGTVDVDVSPEDYDEAADDGYADRLIGRLEDRLVNLRSRPDRAWAGLCTATPDRDPLLGERAPGVYVAAGWQGHGFMRAPAAAEAVVDEMLGGEGVPAFDPGRFDGTESVEVRTGLDPDR
ncbi:MAG: NAD(P)/FAD-dependent oxidoreductase [Halobacteriaceae archaeon]